MTQRARPSKPAPRPTTDPIVTPLPETHATPSEPTATAAELAFQTGWMALRAGDPARAAIELARVPPDAPLGEDAAFWRAIALTRAGQSAAAAQALAAFLAHYPSSAHSGNASVALGWLELARGAPDTARTHFTAAQHDPDPAVRASAERGLVRLTPH